MRGVMLMSMAPETTAAGGSAKTTVRMTRSEISCSLGTVCLMPGEGTVGRAMSGSGG